MRKKPRIGGYIFQDSVGEIIRGMKFPGKKPESPQYMLQKETDMKKLIVILAAALMALAPTDAQSRKDVRTAQKDAQTAAKAIKKEGYKALELGKVETRLESYFIKVYQGSTEIVGTAENCISTNLAKVTALSNAANEYAIREGGVIRGRIISSASSITGEQLDNLVASFERLIQTQVRGQLVPYVTCIRSAKGSYSAKVYCLVDEDAVKSARSRAMEQALEEQSLAEEYGSLVSDWINEGFINADAAALR